MCYWVGARKVREVLLKQLQKKTNDELPQLFYKTFIDKTEGGKNIVLQEHAVAVGKSKPTLTTLIKDDGKLTFRNQTWTLNWNYFDSSLKQNKQGRSLLNSRCENVFNQHKDLIFSNRCIIPVDGYWEFFHYKGNTYPYFIYPNNNELFYLGGIYNEYFDDQTQLKQHSFSIITTPPNDVTAKLHNNPKAHDGSRMLLILDENNLYNYLDESLTQQEFSATFLKPYPASKMSFHPTIRFLKKENQHLFDSPKVQAPFAYPELDQPEPTQGILW